MLLVMTAPRSEAVYVSVFENRILTI